MRPDVIACLDGGPAAPGMPGGGGPCIPGAPGGPKAPGGPAGRIMPGGPGGPPIMPGGPGGGPMPAGPAAAIMPGGPGGAPKPPGAPGIGGPPLAGPGGPAHTAGQDNGTAQTLLTTAWCGSPHATAMNPGGEALGLGCIRQPLHTTVPLAKLTVKHLNAPSAPHLLVLPSLVPWAWARQGGLRA